MFRPIAAIISMVVVLYTVGWKPDDGRNRPKHAVIIILIKHLFRYCCATDWYLHLFFYLLCYYKSLPPVPILSHINPVCTAKTYSFKTHLITTFPYINDCLILLSGFPINYLYLLTIYIFCMLSTYCLKF